MTRQTALRFALIPFAFAALAACNTVEGAGEDIEAGGEAIQEGSNEVSQEISQ